MVGGDVALGENARGYLVQQGLEEVVRCAGQDGDVASAFSVDELLSGLRSRNR